MIHFLKAILCDKVKIIFVPQYEHLSLDDVIEFASDFDLVKDYFPVGREMRKMPRQYICNMVYTILGEQFMKWVKNRVAARNSKVAVTNNLNVTLDPHVAKAFAMSSAVSRRCLLLDGWLALWFGSISQFFIFFFLISCIV
jgi:hypothetical protein